MLILAVAALAAIAFTLAVMVWEYRNDNTNLQNLVDRLEQSREEMRWKIETTERVQKNTQADKPKRRRVTPTKTSGASRAKK
jgi:Flp pilus assembly protein TadB